MSHVFGKHMLTGGREGRLPIVSRSPVLSNSYARTAKAADWYIIHVIVMQGEVRSAGDSYVTMSVQANQCPRARAPVRWLEGPRLGGNESPGRIIFADTAMQVTTYQVSFTTDAPVALSGFSLFLGEDGGSLNRSATNFELMANGAVIANVALAGVGQSYAMKFGSDSIEASGSFSLVTATSFQAIFTNNNGYYKPTL